jgi:hypothetical protein
MPKGPWDTDSGLMDDFDFTITKASFGYRDVYMNGEALLHIWEGESPDGDPGEILWSCGEGWESAKQGAEASHAKRERFVKSSWYGRLIDRAIKELGVDMASRGNPTQAKVWEGLSFHLQREKVEFGTGLQASEHLMPTAFLGAKGKKATTVKKEPVAAADSMMLKRLELLAKGNYLQGFQTKAMELQGIESDQELLASILDDSDQGFWAKHH